MPHDTAHPRSTRRPRAGKRTLLAARLARRVMRVQPPHWERAAAARALGEMGTGACVPGLRAALKDRRRGVWVHAIWGIHKALREGRATRAYRDGLFEAVAALLRRRLDDSHVPATLLMMDRDRARALLLEPKYFHEGGRLHWVILEALNDSGVPAPVKPLAALLHRLRPRARRERGAARQYGVLLVALATAGDPRAAEWAREALRWREVMSGKEHSLGEDAARALAVLAGVTARYLWTSVLAAENRLGFRGLTPPQRHLRCGLEYQYETNNGGVSQFFWNETADLIRATPASLDAVGARRNAALVRAGIRLFGKAGPHRDVERRRTFMVAHSEDRPGAWDRLPYPPGRHENLRALAWLYAEKHPKHFTDAAQPRRRR
jgi:Domain of unknown function (DUF4375)/PBS lyase HEAT-like repeat